MAQALLDEEQVQVRAGVEVFGREARARRLRDVLEADVGRIADDGGKTLAVGQVEEVHHARPRRRVLRVDLDADAPRRHPFPEDAVAASGLQPAAAVAAEREHRVDDRRRGEHLAEGGDVARRRTARQGSGSEAQFELDGS